MEKQMLSDLEKLGRVEHNYINWSSSLGEYWTLTPKFKSKDFGEQLMENGFIAANLREKYEQFSFSPSQIYINNTTILCINIYKK